MYIPKINEQNDQAEIIAFIKRFNFGTIITSENNIPTATHLPFVVVEEGHSFKVISHFAYANPHWKLLEQGEHLIIFAEPHAYISTTHYEAELVVPTWNYMSVHVYGKVKIIQDETAVFDVLDQTIQFYDAAYQMDWDAMPVDFRNRMVKGIVAFEFHPTTIQAKEKLSQNKTANERKAIIDTLSKSPMSVEQQIAEYMKKSF